MNHSKGPYRDIKGPWRVSGSSVSRNGVDNPLVETAYEDNAPILVVAEICGQDRTWEEKVATARLIAAAPTLLYALRNIAAQSIGDDWTTDQAMSFVKKFAREVVIEATEGIAASIDKTDPEKRICDCCGHKGDNKDSSDTESYCGSCGETVPYQTEDLCPACGEKNCMLLACPQCGGFYRLDL